MMWAAIILLIVSVLCIFMGIHKEKEEAGGGPNAQSWWKVNGALLGVAGAVCGVMERLA